MTCPVSKQCFVLDNVGLFRTSEEMAKTVENPKLLEIEVGVVETQNTPNYETVNSSKTWTSWKGDVFEKPLLF